MRPLWLAARHDVPPPAALFDRRNEVQEYVFAPAAVRSRSAVELNSVLTADPRAPADLLRDVLAARTKRRPVLLVVENAEALPSSGAALIRYLGEQLRDLPAGLLLTVRDSELAAAGGIDALIEEVEDGPVTGGAVAAMRLSGLAAAHVAALAAHHGEAVTTDTVEQLRDLTEGNPFLLLEVLQTRRDANVGDWTKVSLQSTVATVLGQRWRLSLPFDRQILSAAAVLATDLQFDIASLSALENVSEHEVARVLGRAKRRRIIDPDRGNAFSHELWRRFIYDQLGSNERARVHYNAMALLEHRPGVLPDDRPLAAEILAHHATLAGDLLPRARRALLSIRAAERAAESNRYEQAAEFYAKAAHLSVGRRKVSLLMATAEAHRIAGTWESATDAFLEAYETAQNRRDHTGMAEAALALRRVTWDPESRAGAYMDSHASAALKMLPSNAVDLRLALQATLVSRGAHVTTEDRTQEALAILGQLGDVEDEHLRGVVLRSIWEALAGEAPPEEQILRAEQVQRLGRQAGSAYLRTVSAADVVVDLLRAGDFQAARGRVKQAGFPTSPPLAFLWASMRALVHLAEGQFEHAEVEDKEAERLGRQFGGRLVEEVVGAQRLWGWYERQGPVSDEVAAEIFGQPHLPGHELPWKLAVALAWVDLAPGGSPRAGDIIRSAAAATSGFTILNRGRMRIAALALAAQILAALDAEVAAAIDGQNLASNVRKALEHHPDSGVVLGWPAIYLGSKKRFIGLAALAAGDAATATVALETACDDDRSCPPHLARTRLALAEALALGGESEASMAHASESLRLAEGLGMPTVVRRARHVLHNSAPRGGRPQPKG